MADVEITLISTLGGQAQIVTFALDYFLQRGLDVKEVVALYLSDPTGRSEAALKRLQLEFADDLYRGKACRFRALPIRSRGRPLSLIQNAADAEATRQTVHTLITQLKQSGRTLYLSIAGGPRMMALMTLSAVQLHCGHQDKVWHMYTEPAFLAQAKAERLLHDERGDRVQMIEVPLVPWGAYLPQFRAASSPVEMMTAQTNWLSQTERQRCQAVWRELTGRQKDVLRAFAQGLTPQEAAERLVISVKTVDSHKTKILAECKLVWELPDGERLDYRFLQERFVAFFE